MEDFIVDSTNNNGSTAVNCEALGKLVKKQNGEIGRLNRLVKKLKGERDLALRNGNNERKREEERLCWISIFPPEVLEMITLYLWDNTDDLINCSRANARLDNVLKENKHLWLFERVLPTIFDSVSQHDLLQLRLSCKRWKDGIDHFLANHPSRRPFTGENHQWHSHSQNDKNQLKSYQYVFGSRQKIAKFMEDTEGRGNPEAKKRNPFIGRSVLIAELDISRNLGQLDPYNFWSDATDITHAFGEHIWYLEIHVDRDPRHLWALLHLLTWNLPNLRSLVVRGRVREINDNDGWGNMQREMQMTMTPLMPLLHLDTLVIDLDRVPVGFRSIIPAMYILQLKKFSTFQNFDQRVLSHQRRLPNLTDLEINPVGGSFDTISQFVACGVSTLAKVTVNFKGPGLDLIVWLEALSTLKSIKILLLNFPSNCQVLIPLISQVDIQRLQVPSLKTLQLHISPKVCFNFLLCFPNLINVHLFMYQSQWPEFPQMPSHVAIMLAAASDRNNFESRVKVHDYLYSKLNGGMYQSNLWNLLIVLKYFTFELIDTKAENSVVFKHYRNRDGYKEFHRNLMC